MPKLFYKLFSSCIPVTGVNRSIICDLNRSKYFFIPNFLAEFLKQNNSIDVDSIIKSLSANDQKTFNEYLELLLYHEVIFKCDEDLLENFPTLSMKWDFPAVISNAIFDAKNTMPWFNVSMLEQLEALCCNYLQLRFYNIAQRSEIERILSLIKNSQIKCFDMIIKYDNSIDQIDWIKHIVHNNIKIRCINIHSADYDKIVENNGMNFGIILTCKDNITSEKHCGVVNNMYFSVNPQLFTESIHHNSCLNRKVSVDSTGKIRNCPSMQEDFGDIKDTTLIEAIEKPGFKKYWDITKDQIETCKNCEFRYICTDCRAYTDDPGNTLSKPLKCGYNPYNNQWEEWSTNPLKEIAKEYYNIH